MEDKSRKKLPKVFTVFLVNYKRLNYDKDQIMILKVK